MWSIHHLVDMFPTAGLFLGRQIQDSVLHISEDTENDHGHELDAAQLRRSLTISFGFDETQQRHSCWQKPREAIEVDDENMNLQAENHEPTAPATRCGGQPYFSSFSANGPN